MAALNPMYISQARYLHWRSIDAAYWERINVRMGTENQWFVRLMNATLGLYAHAAQGVPLASTSLPALAAEGLWVQAMMAERDAASAAVLDDALTDEQALAVTPVWPEPPT